MKLRYSYLIYKIYSWTLNRESDTPIGNTIITLGVVHFFQLLTLLLFIDKTIIHIKWLFNFNKMYLLIGALCYFAALYFLLYNKERWNSYIKEFSDENEIERKRGNILVIVFLVVAYYYFSYHCQFYFLLDKRAGGYPITLDVHLNVQSDDAVFNTQYMLRLDRRGASDEMLGPFLDRNGTVRYELNSIIFAAKENYTKENGI